jgi:hypothetical protein
METLEQPEQPKSTYSNSHKAYYEKNKEQILAKYRESKPYKAHYERNRERLKARALERYYIKKMQREEEQTNPQAQVV